MRSWQPLSTLAPTQTTTASMEIPPGFEPVPGGRPAAESVDAGLLVSLAYAAFTLGFVVYGTHLVRSRARIAAEIRALAARLGERR